MLHVLGVEEEGGTRGKHLRGVPLIRCCVQRPRRLRRAAYSKLLLAAVVYVHEFDFLTMLRRGIEKARVDASFK